jgi:hypothetical protein
MFRAVSGKEGYRGGKFQKCFGQFPGRENRWEENFRTVSDMFRTCF